MARDGYARVQLPEMSNHAARSRGTLRMARRPERVAMGEMLATFPWRLYCTWPFASRIGEEGAVREVMAWLGLLRFAFGRKVGWMIGLEQEPGALWPHAHGLVCSTPDLGSEIVMYEGKRHERRVPLIEPYWRAWFDRHGMGKFEVIDGTGRGCAFYCAKYAAKRGQVIFSDGLERFRGSAPVLEPVTLFPTGGA